MPPRQSSVINRHSVLELPILPFLAPRVFTPWPRSVPRGRAHATVVERGSAYAEPDRIPSSTPTNDAATVPFQRRREDEVPDGITRTIALAMNEEKSLDSPMEGILQSVWQSMTSDTRKTYPDGIQSGTDEGRAITGDSSQELSRTLAAARGRLFTYHRFRKIADRDMPRVRTRNVRLALHQGPHLDSFSSHWSTNISKLNQKYDSQLGHRPIPMTLRHRLARQRERNPLFFKLMADASCSRLSAQWRTLSPRERRIFWPKLMLPALWKSPSSALKFLVASLVKPYPPGYAISDSIEYIVCYYLYRLEDPDPHEVDTLFQVVLRLLDHLDDGYIHLTQKTIFWLLVNLKIDEVTTFYTTLIHRGHPFHENTLLHFIDILARAGKIDLAVDALRRLHEGGADFTKPSIASVCATLLLRRYRSSSEAIVSDSDLFALMLSLGLQPNIIFYNILVQNAIYVGDSDTAWQIHDMMQENGFNADATTYSILLNDAKVRMDRPTIERILGIVRSKHIRNEYIVTDLLHAMFILNERERKAALTGEPPSSPFKQMLSLYAEFFSTAPLKDILPRAYRNHLPESNERLMHPPKQTLTVMLIALLRGFTSKATTEWYDRFRSLVLQGDLNIAPLAESTHIYDAVLMSLGRWHGTLHLCTKVVRDMYDSHAQSLDAHISPEGPSPSKPSKSIDAEESQRSEELRYSGSSSPLEDHVPWSPISSSKGVPVLGLERPEIDVHLENDKPRLPRPKKAREHQFMHCQPSVRTWSILLKSFMDHHQPRAAEKVLTMMQDRGITPNQVTWNSLAVGYARMQDIANTVNVIERFENEGWEVDECTMKGLQWIQNRETLIQALQQKDNQQEEKQLAAERRGAVSPAVLSENVGELLSTAEEMERKRQLWSLDSSPRKRRPLPMGFNAGDLAFPEIPDVLGCHVGLNETRTSISPGNEDI